MAFFPQTWHKSQTFDLGFSLNQIPFSMADICTFQSRKNIYTIIKATPGSGAAKGNTVIIHVISYTFAFPSLRLCFLLLVPACFHRENQLCSKQPIYTI